jgi:CBS domain-containing membrane protein
VGKPTKASDIMKREVITVMEQDNLLSIEEGMERFGMRHLPVVDGDKLVGLVTHRDILRVTRSSLRSYRLDREIDRRKQEETFVADVMTREVLTIDPDTPLKEAARIIVDNRIGCLPVIDAERRLLGILTEFDLVRLIAEGSVA